MAVPQYIRNAQNNYNSKFDIIQIKLPSGTKERINAIIGDDASMAAYCKAAVLKTIESDEYKTYNNSIENAQNAPTSNENTKADKSIDEVSNADMLAELQAELDARKVKHPDEMTADEREQVRQESIIKSECPF